MRVFLLLLIFAGGSALAQAAQSADSDACEHVTYEQTDYVVCRADPDANDIRLFLNNSAGEPYGHFNKVNDALAEKGERLTFAMNAGMYHEDRAPVGLYIENGEALAPLNDNDGPGNFNMKPNGVFWIYFEHGMKVAGISVSENFELEAPDAIYHATQSGPMLVIDGKIHPRFLPESSLSNVATASA